jgi:hypothetical protein
MKTKNIATEPNEKANLTELAPLIGCGLFLFLLLLVNVARTDLNPTWHFISEYGIGPMGWMMQLAFLGFAAAHFALVKSVLPSLGGKLGWLAAALLLAAGAGLLLGGIFKADPMLTPPGLGTTSGAIHNIGGGLGIAMPFAAFFLTKLLRREQYWRESRWILPLAVAAIASSVVTIIAFGAYLSASGGVIEPGMPLGIFNRLEILIYALWFMAVAIRLWRR